MTPHPSAERHVITCEYPPQVGGVADYTRTVVRGLARANEVVHVWCPGEGSPEPDVPTVHVHGGLGRASPRDLLALGRRLDTFPAPRRLLVQWVPHGYGYRSMNVFFCLWLRHRASRGDAVEIVVHEPYLAFGEGSLRQDAAALLHRVMMVLLLRAATRVWVSIPAWADAIRPYTVRRKVEIAWLPVPSVLTRQDDPTAVARVRARHASGSGPIVGHFGTHGDERARLVGLVLERVLRSRPDVSVLLLGRGGHALERDLRSQVPGVRVHATGVLAPAELSHHLQACDVMVLPYPDGVSSRRTTVMAALSHAVAVVTNRGRLTDPVWLDTDAVRLASGTDPDDIARAVLEVASDPMDRRRLSASGRAMYESHFDLSRVVAALTASPAAGLAGRTQSPCASRS